jgi:hypothetical protein
MNFCVSRGRRAKRSGVEGLPGAARRPCLQGNALIFRQGLFLMLLFLYEENIFEDKKLLFKKDVHFDDDGGRYSRAFFVRRGRR